MKKRYVLPIPILILIAVIAGFTLGTLDQTLADWAARLLTYVRGLGAWGPVVIVVTMMIVCVTSLPGAPLTLGCGFLFGVWKGTLIATAGATLGASAAYVLGRTFARNWVKRSISRRARFARLDRATQHHGFTIVLLSRLSPLFPFNLLNYAFSVTAVKFRDYFIATMLGVIPACFVWVYMGTFMKTIAEVATGKVDPATVKAVGSGAQPRDYADCDGDSRVRCEEDARPRPCGGSDPGRSGRNGRSTRRDERAACEFAERRRTGRRPVRVVEADRSCRSRPSRRVLKQREEP